MNKEKLFRIFIIIISLIFLSLSINFYLNSKNKFNSIKKNTYITHEISNDLIFFVEEYYSYSMTNYSFEKKLKYLLMDNYLKIKLKNNKQKEYMKSIFLFIKKYSLKKEDIIILLKSRYKKYEKKLNKYFILPDIMIKKLDNNNTLINKYKESFKENFIKEKNNWFNTFMMDSKEKKIYIKKNQYKNQILLKKLLRFYDKEYIPYNNIMFETYVSELNDKNFKYNLRLLIPIVFYFIMFILFLIFRKYISFFLIKIYDNLIKYFILIFKKI